MKRSNLAVVAIAGISVAFGLGSVTTIANERWDGISVCVNHETRNVTAASGNKCPGGSTLKRMGLEGADGEDGLDGTQILSGQGSPNISLGVVGDFYIDLTTGTLHGPKKENGWSNALSLRGSDGANGSGSRGPAGPAGPQGPAGPTGPQGPAGADGGQAGFFSIVKDAIDVPIDNGGTVVATIDNLPVGFYLANFNAVLQRTDNFGNGPIADGSCYIFSDGDSQMNDMAWASNVVYINDPSLTVEPYSRAYLSGNTWVEIQNAGDKLYIDCGHSASVGDETATLNPPVGDYPVVLETFTLHFTEVAANKTNLNWTKGPIP